MTRNEAVLEMMDVINKLANKRRVVMDSFLRFFTGLILIFMFFMIIVLSLAMCIYSPKETRMPEYRACVSRVVSQDINVTQAQQICDSIWKK